MAEGARAPPSIEGIFRVLAQIPQDRLAGYERKLSHRQGDLRLCHLLHIMILLTLRREAEARRSLDALGYDLVAARICRSHWGSGKKASKADPVPPKQDAEVALVVAQLYALLAEEKLCHPQARNEAYRAAVQAFQDSQVEVARLKSLLEEARGKCGEGFASVLPSGHGGVLAPDPGRSPVLPVSLHPSLDPQSLRSTGTPLSFVSHFEISSATTLPPVPKPDWQPAAEAGEVGGSTSTPLGMADKEEEHGQRSPAKLPLRGPEESATKDDGKKGSTGDFKHGPSLPGPAEPRVTQPAEGDAQQTPERSLPRNLETPSVPQPGSPTPAKSAEGSSPQTQMREATPHNSLASAFPPTPAGSSQGDQSQFFSFVVLHAGEDEDIACRVKKDLEEMGVSDGATYSEDFLVPGHSQLGCFQDALDNSAFTLLLLTENFRSRFCAYQTSVALMDSFQRFCKSNTVIPFIPKENPLPPNKMPTVLAGLVPLNENSPVFRKRVKNTFAAGAIQEKKAMWRARKQVQERERLQERQRDYQQMLQRLSELSADAPPPSQPTGFPGCPWPPGHSPQPPFPMPPPGGEQPSFSQPFLVSLGSGGPQPQFIIQHAQMIQIGDYNCMQADRTSAMPGTAEEDVRED